MTVCTSKKKTKKMQANVRGALNEPRFAHPPSMSPVLRAHDHGTNSRWTDA